MNLAGTAWVLGDNVSTDEIVPGRYLGVDDPAELARQAFEGAAPGLVDRIAQGDILVGGANFGTGSSREQAPRAIRAAGFGAIVAASFARIFFRNCVNVGLPVFWSPEAAADVAEGDRVEINPEAGQIVNVTQGAVHRAAPLPPFVREIVASGGLSAYASQRLGGSLVPAGEVPSGEGGRAS
ncbi:MAG: 3-isopropylmalate dehydratase small subunit [Actinomycetia bacterium]|nr:3-isopropylmalate dehydratase small subunit [Actinomycetes bacterium]